MKKGKVFGKSQIALAVMVVALAGAVWLNMRYSGESTEASGDTPSKYLGSASYVNGEASEEDNTASDPVGVYFSRLRSDRLKTREDAYATLEESLKSTDASEDSKKTALDRMTVLAARTEKEAAIETLLRAKGFEYSVAVIGDEDINVVVEGEDLTSAEILQIQDAAISQTAFAVNQVKIVAMSEQEIQNALK